MPSLTTTERWFAIVVSWLSAALLVWTAHGCLAAWVFQEVGEPQRFTLVARDGTPRNPRSSQDDIWLSEVLVDGHHLLPKDIRVEGAWTGWGWGLREYHATAQGSAWFTGRSAVVELQSNPWSGMAKVRDGRVRRSSTPIRLGRLRFTRTCRFGRGRGGPGRWFAVPALASLILVGPWRSGRRTEAWLLLCCAAAHAIVWCTMPVETNQDSPWYFEAFRAALEGAPSFFPFGYGILMALADALPGSSLGAKVTLLQHGMMVTTLLMIWRLVRLYTSWWLSAAWFFVTSWLLPTLLLPQALFSENLSLLAMATAIFFTRRAVERGGIVSELMAGVGLGLATLARVVPLGVAGPAMWLMFLDRPAAGGTTAAPTSGRTRRFFTALVPHGVMRRRAALAFGTAAAIVLTPMCWYVVNGNHFTLSTGVPSHLYNRVLCEQKLIDRDGAATKELQQLIPGVDPTTVYPWDLVAKIRDKVGYFAAQALMAKVVKEAVLTDPAGYLIFTFDLTWRNLVADAAGRLLHAANMYVDENVLELQAEPLLRYSAGAGTWAEHVGLAYGPVWVALCWLAVLGVLALPWMPRRLLIGALLWTALGYMLATSAVEFLLPRYNAGITPFVTAVAVVPLAAIDHALRRRRRHPAVTAAEPPPMPLLSLFSSDAERGGEHDGR